MTPPSTLRLSGIAATVVALVLMGANRTDHRVVRHEAPEARFEYVFAQQVAEARAGLAAARTAEYVNQAEHAQAIARAYDALARAAHPAPAAKVRVLRRPHQPPVTPESPGSPAAGR